MFIDLRLTPSFCGIPTSNPYDDGPLKEDRYWMYVNDKNDCETNLRLVIEYLGNYLDLGKEEGALWYSRYIAGFEDRNSHNEPTHLHLHLRMEVCSHRCKPIVKENIKKYFNRKCNWKGVKCFCLNVYGDTDDEHKFFRYGLKQGEFTVCKDWYNFSDSEINKMTDVANGQWVAHVESKRASRLKNENKNMFQHKMFKHLDETFDNKVNQRAITMEIAKYYMNSNMTPPFKSLKDKALHYMLVKKWVGLEDVYKVDDFDF